jgi:hypothetical protein
VDWQPSASRSSGSSSMRRNRGWLSRAEREHGFRHSVDYAQKRAGHALWEEFASFPIAHCRDRYTDLPRELGL